jgi:hypothetical protein
MNRWWLAGGLGIGAALLVSVATAQNPDCASVTASTRLEAYGYTHVVTLANRCPVPVTCEVWTNVDPEPHLSLRAKAGENAEVVTRRGSPSRAVQAGKSCAFTK